MPNNLWAKKSDAGRHAIAEAVFERIDVLGLTDYTFTLTAHAKARGWDAAFGAGAESSVISRSGRGERSRGVTFQLIVRVVGRQAGTSDTGTSGQAQPA
ncbi:MAG: hypothetical protein H0T59_02010 [Chloroflexi bacterium]|nr:hypothetical protein [Chloroflexota bacterium]